MLLPAADFVPASNQATFHIPLIGITRQDRVRDIHRADHDPARSEDRRNQPMRLNAPRRRVPDRLVTGSPVPSGVIGSCCLGFRRGFNDGPR